MDRRLPIVLWLIMAWFATSAGAATVERLLMPGPLIEGHAKYEDKCETCHESFSKKSQRRLCLACHKKVAADIDAGAGFHGRRAADKSLECKSCHTDHKGRSADIVLLVPESFDHKATDFSLLGAHASARCGACHMAGKKYRDAPTACVECHRKQDPHKGHLGDKCGDCHKTVSWRQDAQYDHDKTKFALHNKHAKVACDACHPDARFKDTPVACAACHRLNDVHGGRLGEKCGDCHSDKAWKESRFEHDRKTKFPLLFKHKELPCNACHKTVEAKDKPPHDCIGCHRADDVHKGRNGTACGDCHDAKDWKQAKFDHLRASGYALKGAHEKLDCNRCHKGPVHEVALESACSACHKNDDAHSGKLGTACERCHNEKGWTKDVLFEHDITRFPLIGLHATAPCEACHVTAVYRDTPMACDSCHGKDDKHKGALGKECNACHTPNGWKLWRFDHDRATKFVLDGAHKGLVCEACHRAGTSPKISSSCAICHGGNDVHHGDFGQQCDRCHVTTRFDDLHLLDKSLGPGKGQKDNGR